MAAVGYALNQITEQLTATKLSLDALHVGAPTTRFSTDLNLTLDFFGHAMERMSPDLLFQ